MSSSHPGSDSLDFEQWFATADLHRLCCDTIERLGHFGLNKPDKNKKFLLLELVRKVADSAREIGLSELADEIDPGDGRVKDADEAVRLVTIVKAWCKRNGIVHSTAETPNLGAVLEDLVNCVEARIRTLRFFVHVTNKEEIPKHTAEDVADRAHGLYAFELPSFLASLLKSVESSQVGTSEFRGLPHCLGVLHLTAFVHEVFLSCIDEDQTAWNTSVHRVSPKEVRDDWAFVKSEQLTKTMELKKLSDRDQIEALKSDVELLTAFIIEQLLPCDDDETTAWDCLGGPRISAQKILDNWAEVRAELNRLPDLDLIALLIVFIRDALSDGIDGDQSAQGVSEHRVEIHDKWKEVRTDLIKLPDGDQIELLTRFIEDVLLPGIRNPQATRGILPGYARILDNWADMRTELNKHPDRDWIKSRQKNVEHEIAVLKRRFHAAQEFQRRESSRKKTHEDWAKLKQKDPTLSNQEIANIHNAKTGETITGDGVRKALKRLR